MAKKNTLIFCRAARYVCAFGFTVLLAMVLLIACAYLPQERIQQNMIESISFVNRDLENNKIFDRSKAAYMDVGTDVMILRTSLSTRSSYLGSILTNPVYKYEGLSDWEDMGETFARLAYEMPHDSVLFYTGYWMGFRVPMRLALTFLNYGQIKRYLAFLFFLLFAAAMSSVAKNTNAKQAFLFAISIILVRPYVVATSMQFTCCFLIAFIGMLFIPAIYRHQRVEALYFMEMGMITMYFDFYTVPLITFGFPMLYLCLICMENGNVISPKRMIRDLFSWFMGYGLMWIAKLVLTSVLTEVNALKNGFNSFAGRIGLRKTEGLEEYYSVKAALDGVKEAIFSDEIGKVIYLSCVVLIVGYVLAMVIRRGNLKKRFCSGVPFLILAAIPIAWFCITKQPVAIHAYFQYRSIVLTHWGAGVFLYCLIRKDNNPIEKKPTQI